MRQKVGAEGSGGGAHDKSKKSALRSGVHPPGGGWNFSEGDFHFRGTVPSQGGVEVADLFRTLPFSGGEVTDLFCTPFKG